MNMQEIDAYFSSNLHKPFFLAVGDSEYNVYKARFEKSGVDFLHLSSCCYGDDKKPDMDKFRSLLRTADVDCDTNRVVVLGLGEYLALEGSKYANDFLSEMANFNLGIAHVVFLLRGVSSTVRSLINSDPRYQSRQMIVDNDSESVILFNFSTKDLGMYQKSGLKYAIECVEDGREGAICVNTDIAFPDSLYQIIVTKDSFEAIRKKNPSIGLVKDYGDEKQWDNLLLDVNKYKGLDKVFEKYQFADLLASDFYQYYSKQDYVGWLSFIYLKTLCGQISNKYLLYVVDHSNSYEEYKNNVLNSIISIPHTDHSFDAYYESRKRLVQSFPESDIAVFVSNNRIQVDESIYKLTNNTNVEREEIIAYCSQYGLPSILSSIYPELAAYMKSFHFTGEALNELLTGYFDEYKKQKVANSISNEFLDQVNHLAVTREYNRLRTRDEIVGSLDNNGSFLCWIDALGVEYLSYISELAIKRGLAVTVSVGRAELPTITSINKKFYDIWSRDKRKIETLDDIKHNEKGGYKYGPSNIYPIHLAKELQVLSDVIDEAATELGLHNFDKYVIASDHGASRLAVIRNKEEKYDTDTSGEHSGRCCKRFDDYDLPFATEENGYVILADYGRFKGSRAANVEVHGGASLEEVVVPIITLSLRDMSITMKIVEQLVKADYRTGITFTLFVNKTVSSPVSVDYKGTRYDAAKQDNNHYKIIIEDIKKAGTYPLDVYLGEDLIAHLSVVVVSRSGSTNDDFDDLF